MPLSAMSHPHAAALRLLPARRCLPSTHAHSACCAGGAGLRVSGSYIRDPEDGTLRPALILELENVNLRQLPSPPTQLTIGSRPSMGAPGTRRPLSFSAATAAQAMQPHDQAAAVARAPSATNRVAGRREMQHKVGWREGGANGVCAAAHELWSEGVGRGRSASSPACKRRGTEAGRAG